MIRQSDLRIGTHLVILDDDGRTYAVQVMDSGDESVKVRFPDCRRGDRWLSTSRLRGQPPPSFERFTDRFEAELWEEALAEFIPDFASREMSDGYRDWLPLHRLLCVQCRGFCPALEALAHAVLEAYPAAAREVFCGSFPLHSCLDRGAPEAITLEVLRRFPNAARQQNGRGRSALHIAVCKGTTDAVTKALLAAHPEAASRSADVLADVLCGVEDLSREVFFDMVQACPSVPDSIGSVAYNNKILTKAGMLLILEYAHSHGLGNRACDAEVLVAISLALKQHESLDGLSALTRVGASTMLSFEAARAILAERSSPPACARFLRVWHHGEALHVSLLELSLMKVLPGPAATAVAAILHGKCINAKCSCHRYVARWKHAATGSAMAQGRRFA